MKTLIVLGVVATTLFIGGTAFADAAKGMKLQELFAWSAQGTKSAASVPAYQQYPGYSDSASTH